MARMGKAKVKRRAHSPSSSSMDLARAPDMNEVRVPSARFGIPMTYIGAALVVLAAIIVMILYFSGVLDKNTEDNGSGSSVSPSPSPGADVRQQFTLNTMSSPQERSQFFAGLATINPQTKRVRITSSGDPTLGGADLETPTMYSLLSPGTVRYFKVTFDKNGKGYGVELLNKTGSTGIATIGPPPPIPSLSLDIEGDSDKIMITSREFPGTAVAFDMSIADFIDNLRITTDISYVIHQAQPSLSRVVIETNPSNFYDADTSRKDFIGALKKDGLSGGAVAGIVIGAIVFVILMAVFVFRTILTSSGRAQVTNEWEESIEDIEGEVSGYEGQVREAFSAKKGGEAEGLGEGGRE